MLRCVQLFVTQETQSPSVRRHLQAIILGWIAISSSRASSRPRDRTRISYVSCIGRQILSASTTWEAQTPADVSPKGVLFVCLFVFGGGGSEVAHSEIKTGIIRS